MVGEDLLATCKLIIIKTKESQHQFFLAYLCVFCGAVTISSDLSHSCPNDQAPDPLRQKSEHIYLKPKKIELCDGKISIIYERIG